MSSIKLKIYIILSISLITTTSKLFKKPSSLTSTNSCTPEEASFFFSQKILSVPLTPYNSDPYLNPSEEYLKKVQDFLNDKTSVCAIRYTDSTKITYEMQSFSSRKEAEDLGFYVTHQGTCGACSTLRDLSIYLDSNLTTLVRRCAFKTVYSMKRAKKCVQDVGFTDKCGEIWLFNARNTRKKCFSICMWSWIWNEPNNKPNGDLNDCLQCDEDLSGPIFKFESGRSRRNSGIKSEIDRPDQQVYDVDQCYF
jgi:hypothetical protein